MISERLARDVALTITIVLLIQIVPCGYASTALAEQSQDHSVPRIVAFGSGIASISIGIDQAKLTVLFSYANPTDAIFSSFVRVDTNDSSVAQSKDPSIAIAPNDDIVVVWSQMYFSFSRIFISLSSDQGDSFSTPMLVTESASGNQTGPEIAVANGVI